MSEWDYYKTCIGKQCDVYWKGTDRKLFDLPDCRGYEKFLIKKIYDDGDRLMLIKGDGQNHQFRFDVIKDHINRLELKIYG